MKRGYLNILRLASTLHFALLVVMTCGAQGCKSSAQQVDAEYRTIGGDLRRDSESARRENIRAVSLIEQNKWEEAEQVLKAALEADITFGPAHNNLGKVYYHQRKLYLAAWEFQYAIKAMPFQPEPRNNLGLVLEAAGKLEDAVQCYDEAGKMQEDNPIFAGNSAHARLQRGDRDAVVIELLQKVTTNSDEPSWVEWAREKLVMLRTRSP